MADIKTSTVRNTPAVGAARVPTQMRADPRPPVQGRPPVEGRIPEATGGAGVDPSSALISDFILPAPRTMAWLSDPRLTATLQAASASLAPDGVTEDPTDRYAASVLETHLSARRRLSKLTNSLLKT